jgi:transposase
MDLHEPYRQAVQMVLPQAAIVADKFHVIALAQDALREVRRGRRQRGNLAWLLDRGVERLSAQEERRLAVALAGQPELARAWGLKEGLRSLYRSPSYVDAARGLDSWLQTAWASRLPSFQRLAGTVQRWREEIVNYWRFPLTNALVEGKHNRVKVMKRRAYGYRNRRVFLLRFLNLVHTD